MLPTATKRQCPRLRCSMITPFAATRLQALDNFAGQLNDA
jgi:hypothetical protein